MKILNVNKSTILLIWIVISLAVFNMSTSHAAILKDNSELEIFLQESDMKKYLINIINGNKELPFKAPFSSNRIMATRRDFTPLLDTAWFFIVDPDGDNLQDILTFETNTSTSDGTVFLGCSLKVLNLNGAAIFDNGYFFFINVYKRIPLRDYIGYVLKICMC